MASGYQYFVLGNGKGMVMHKQPCPDIPCNTGDKCSCVTVGGNAMSEISGGKAPIPTSFTVELSVDDSATINNGASGACFGSTGILGLTLPKGTLSVPFSGLACRIPDIPNSRTFGISAPASIASGTGKYANPTGTGAFTGTFSPTSRKVTIDITGFAQFHQ